jgi:hypothetical protein
VWLNNPLKRITTSLADAIRCLLQKQRQEGAAGEGKKLIYFFSCEFFCIWLSLRIKIFKNILFSLKFTNVSEMTRQNFPLLILCAAEELVIPASCLAFWHPNFTFKF